MLFSLTALSTSNAEQGSPNCQILPNESIIYGEVIKNANQLEKFNSFAQPDLLLTVRG
jgi:hypothetical protein